MKRLLIILGILLSVTAVPSIVRGQGLLAPVTSAISANSSDCSVANSCVVLYVSPQSGGVGISITGTWLGTLNFEGSVDQGNWNSEHVFSLSGGASITSTTGNGIWQFSNAGMTAVRVRGQPFISGSAVITLQPSLSAPTPYAITAPNPCVSGVLQTKGISFASTTAQLLVSASGTKTSYICWIHAQAEGTGETLSIIDGTQTTNPCDSGAPVALDGSTTAANGNAMAANTGWVGGNSAAPIYIATGANRQICAITAGSNRVTISIVWVQQ